MVRQMCHPWFNWPFRSLGDGRLSSFREVMPHDSRT